MLKVENIHFIGIGGIGLSSLAKFLSKKGYKISGSDISKSLIIDDLRLNFNINIKVPFFKTEHMPKIDIAIYSAIIPPSNKEYEYCKKQGIKLLSRKNALKFILKDKKVYAIAGSHGKSTTSAILTSIIPKTNSLIGAISKDIQSNMRYYKDNNKVIFEADESDASFLNSNPYLAIITNTDPEHMEYYNYDLKKFYSSYRNFLNLATVRIINAEDKFLSSLKLKAIRFYPSKDIKNIKYKLINNEPYTQFSLKNLGIFQIFGLGEHIIIDASLAILAAIELGEDIEDIRSNILNYVGIKKRFDILKISHNIIIDDYAHHPTEIKATINALKIYQKLIKFKKIQVIWQPHKYSRTIDNLSGYVDCFMGIDELVILPVWSAGEKQINIDFQKEFSNYNLLMADSITQKNNSVEIIKDGNKVKKYNEGLTISFGAGDITNQIRGLKL